MSRTPILCLNNNKSIGVYDNFDASSLMTTTPAGSSTATDAQSSLPKLQPSTSLSNKQPHEQHQQQHNSISNLLDQVLTANMKRSLDMKLKLLLMSNMLTLEWLSEPANSAHFDSRDEITLAWLFYAKHVFSQSSQQANQIEKLLNILSTLLEMNPKCELVWLVYLKCYLEKRNALSDYHEIAMLCMDNLITYDLVWFILATCPTQFVDLIFERYEKYLAGADADFSVKEFEQRPDENDEPDQNMTDNAAKNVSFYLLEVIVYHVYLKIITQSVSLREGSEEEEERCLVARQLLKSYLSKQQIMFKLEPVDLSVLWLSYIHLEAFLHLPNWLKIPNHSYLIDHNNGDRNFWLFSDQRRVFNSAFFATLNTIYQSRCKLAVAADSATPPLLLRNYDLFLLPWKQQGQSSTEQVCSVERLQSLFHESLKAVSARCATYSKQDIRLFSLPIFLNMIHLTLMSGRIEIGTKLCERLLKDAGQFKELWFSLINLQLIANAGGGHSSTTLDAAIESCLLVYPNDAQVVFTVGQFFFYKVCFNL
jgi:hypothetical protein